MQDNVVPFRKPKFLPPLFKGVPENITTAIAIALDKQSARKFKTTPLQRSRQIADIITGSSFLEEIVGHPVPDPESKDDANGLLVLGIDDYRRPLIQWAIKRIEHPPRKTRKNKPTYLNLPQS